MTKINCPKLSKVTSNILDFPGFRKKRKKEREKERESNLIKKRFCANNLWN